MSAVFSWNGYDVVLFGRKTVIINIENYHLTPEIQAVSTNTKTTTEAFNDEDKLTVYNIPQSVGFQYSHKTKGIRSTRRKYIEDKLAKAIEKIPNLLLSIPPVEDEES